MQKQKLLKVRFWKAKYSLNNIKHELRCEYPLDTFSLKNLLQHFWFLILDYLSQLSQYILQNIFRLSLFSPVLPRQVSGLSNILYWSLAKQLESTWIGQISYLSLTDLLIIWRDYLVLCYLGGFLIYLRELRWTFGEKIRCEVEETVAGMSA